MSAPMTKNQMSLLMSDSVSFRPAETVRPSLLSRIARFFAALSDLPRRRAVIDELSTLTDRELADIGLNRSELGRVFDPRFVQARRG